MTITIPMHSLEIHPIAASELDAVLDVYRQCEDFLALGSVPTASMEMVGFCALLKSRFSDIS